MKSRIPDREYKKILELMPICCVESMILHRGRVLLVKRNMEPCKGEWWFPGGRIRKNEGIEEAAERKALEEAGIKAKAERKIGTYETRSKYGPYGSIKNGVHTINTCVLVKPVSSKIEVSLDSTSSGYRWFDVDDKTLNQYIKNAIRDARPA